jgi:hypothetical protein
LYFETGFIFSSARDRYGPERQSITEKNKEIFYERGKLNKEKVIKSERKQQIKKVWRSGRK